MDAELLPPPGAAPDPPAQPAARAPYVGPRAFRPGERLYGRDREARELMDVLVAERIVLCHSPSGAGKTSLIQALLAPRLTEARFAVYGPTRVGSEMGAEGAAAGANRYVLSALIGMEKGRPDPLPLDRLAEMTLTGYLDLRAADDADHDPVLIFDQFEEVLTIDSNDVDAKTEFFRQVGAALRPRHRWALFAMREEFVAALDPYLHLVPTQLASRYPLQLLDARGARDAIEKPAADAGVPFTAEALDRLVKNLRMAPQPGSPDGVLGRWVEPVQLQVVCTRLWQKLKPDTTEIGTELVGGVADVDTALADYYAETVARVAREAGAREGNIRRWFEKALISGGVRTQVARGGERAYKLDEQVVNALVNAYLVRREERRSSIWYELAHDRLMAAVNKDNARWFRTANLKFIGSAAAALVILATVVGGTLLMESFERVTTRQEAETIERVEQAVIAATALQQAEARGDTVQPGITVWYFPKRADPPNIVQAMRDAGFTVDSKNPGNEVPSNYVYYGDSVRVGTLRVLALTLLRAGVPLKGICPLNHQSGRRQTMQVLGRTGMDGDPTLTADRIAAIADGARWVNCPLPTVYLQFFRGGDEGGDRQRMEALRAGLNQAGYDAPGVEGVDARVNEVRYFEPEEWEMAAAVSALAARHLGLAAPLPIVHKRGGKEDSPIEVWVDLAGRPASAPRQ